MPRFQYVASDAEGKENSGAIEAVNKVAALSALKKMGLRSARIVEGAVRTNQKGAARAKSANLQIHIPLPAFLKPKVKKKHLMVFIRQLATLIDAGVPLLRALNIMRDQEPNVALKNMLRDMAETVESGGTFADALSQHPKVFDKLFVNMVKAGEVGGVLEVSLNRLAEFTEKAERIKTKVVGAMIYPIVVLFLALSMIVFMMIFIIPKFTEIFADLVTGTELPLITQLVVSTSNFIIQRFPLIIVGVVSFVVLFKFFGNTKTGSYFFDVLKLKIPLVKILVSKSSISRFTRTLGTLMTSGVAILQALTIVRDTSGNEVIARAIQSVHDSVKEGETVADPLRASGVFPVMVVSMITVGEETGRLPDMLMKIADTYDNEVDTAVDGITSVIEPLLIVFLAVIVAVIVIAMFMPLVSIITDLK